MTTIEITPGVRQAAPYAFELMLTRAEYGAKYGFKERTMQRYLAEGRIEGAVKDERGEWRIPASAQVSPARATTDVVRQAAPGVPQDSSRLAYAIPVLVSLEDMAAAMGTTIGGLRRLANAGLLDIGPYGPHGALRVVLRPTS